MSKLLELRQKIGAVENIQTITRTLATVAAAKLSRTRRRAAGMRVYAQRIREMVSRQQASLARRGLDPGALSSLLQERQPIRRVALLVVAADRGMCGGYNLEVCRHGLEFWERCRKAGREVAFVLKGSRGAGFFRRRRAHVLHQESWRRGALQGEDVERLLVRLLNFYRSGQVDAVYAVYTEFHSPIHRRPRVVRILPVELPGGADAAIPQEAGAPWSYEPDLATLIDELLTVYLRVQLTDVLLESYASEQGARMITMEEASERAERSLQEYRVQYNRLRREMITIDLLGTLFASRAVEETGGAPARPA
jgi:F-type H+-transporting ATPase subunit gamma